MRPQHPQAAFPSRLPRVFSFLPSSSRLPQDRARSHSSPSNVATLNCSMAGPRVAEETTRSLLVFFFFFLMGTLQGKMREAIFCSANVLKLSAEGGPISVSNLRYRLINNRHVTRFRVCATCGTHPANRFK